MAINIDAARMMGSFASNKAGVQGGSNENPRPIAPSTPTAPAIGVRRPMTSNVPTIRAAKPMNHISSAGFGSFRYNRPWTRKALPATARNNKRAIPGDPTGNPGNKRCSWCLLVFSGAVETHLTVA